MTDAYDAGYSAYLNGIPRTDNPYDGPEAALWEEGWSHAKEDAEGCCQATQPHPLTLRKIQPDEEETLGRNREALNHEH